MCGGGGGGVCGRLHGLLWVGRKRQVLDGVCGVEFMRYHQQPNTHTHTHTHTNSHTVTVHAAYGRPGVSAPGPGSGGAGGGAGACACVWVWMCVNEHKDGACVFVCVRTRL